MNYKSRLAYESTCERFKEYCDGTGHSMYFWRWSFKEHYLDGQIGFVMNRVLTFVRNRYRSEPILFGGIRVMERHKSGRPHVHCIVNKRIPIDWLQEEGHKYGLGWCWVERVEKYRAAISYIAKYLEKANEFKGTRIPVWGTIGHAPFRTTSSAIIITNERTKFMSRIRREIFGDAKLPNWLARAVYQSWHIGYLEREDFIIWKACTCLHGVNCWEAWEALNWPVWYIQQEMEGIGQRDLDGRIPF